MNVQNEVSNVVDDFVGKYRMFTAYDVTKMVRHRASQLGLNDRVSHYGSGGVRDLVQTMWRNGDFPSDYTFTTVTVDATKGIAAIVYHDNGDDPNVYDSVWVEREIANAISPAPVVAPVAVNSLSSCAVPQPVDDDEDDDDVDSFVDPGGLSDYVIATDQRGRACVPAQAINDVKTQRDDLFVAVVKTGEIVLIPGSNSGNYPPGSVNTYRYMVDKSGNVRVSRSVLAKAGLNPDNVDIAVDPNNKEIILT